MVLTWWWVAWLVGAAARELDPGACATRFDVQRDKIIRTEESREMGARYLSELDVGTRHECLRLCCETDACDVFVYEEKSPGSCYLFTCGPPEDFRCKFTAHSNFSSGVLVLSRRLAELQDLERLGAAAPARTRPPTTTLTTTTASTTTKATEPPPPPPPPPPVLTEYKANSAPTETPGRCSRYQFECRQGGECIAVYNACDGIAQCADGSDEAPELGCPAQAPPRPTAQPDTPPIQESPIEPEESARWPHRLTQAQPQYRYTEAGNVPHIFSHKGGLVQEEGAPPYDSQWRRGWPAPPPQPPYRRPGLENSGWEGYAQGDWSPPDPRRAWPVPRPPPDTELNMYMNSKTMPELPVPYGAPGSALRDSPKKGFELPPPATPPPAPPVATAAPAPPPRPYNPPLENTTTKKTLKDHTAPENSIRAEPRAQHEPHLASERNEHDEHDGLSEHPPAAVFLLVLGVLMTGVVGALLGCRARAARRRLRRGKAYAHDADYLVNGMYL